MQGSTKCMAERRLGKYLSQSLPEYRKGIVFYLLWEMYGQYKMYATWRLQFEKLGAMLGTSSHPSLATVREYHA